MNVVGLIGASLVFYAIYLSIRWGARELTGTHPDTEPKTHRFERKTTLKDGSDISFTLLVCWRYTKQPPPAKRFVIDQMITLHLPPLLQDFLWELQDIPVQIALAKDRLSKPPALPIDVAVAQVSAFPARTVALLKSRFPDYVELTASIVEEQHTAPAALGGIVVGYHE
jgi:hypothetical protein